VALFISLEYQEMFSQLKFDNYYNPMEIVSVVGCVFFVLMRAFAFVFSLTTAFFHSESNIFEA
jgi:quinol-cytochrome oxidoreductase complex cytochrome b subunit